MIKNKSKAFAKLCGVVALFAFVGQSVAQEWTDLIGSDLSNWEKKGGTGSYALKDGVITGTLTEVGGQNTFLTTKKHYSDFILEFDVWCVPGFNSGVQFRSNSKPSFKDGRVHGYQMEIDPTKRAYTGGIFDEGRRKWLYPLTLNPDARSLFVPSDWNSVRIEAIGKHIRTWVNGEMVANLVDNMDASGFIGLQVHSIRDNSLLDAEVKWRNMRILTKHPEKYRHRANPNVPEQSYLVNQLTEHEKRNGFRLLWDGKTNTGWQGAKLDGFPKKGWQMKDGVLTVLATDGGESTGPGDIVTNERFSDFELELEFKLTEGANSGIKYFVDPELNKGPGSAIGLEFQLLDDEKHPDAKMGVEGNRTLGSLYDLITASDLSNTEPQRKGRYFKGIGEWNKARIVVKDGHVQHWLNNVKVIDFDRHSQIFKALVAYSKYAKWPNFGQLPEGNILLQDHGDTVHYRSIKIREFAN